MPCFTGLVLHNWYELGFIHQNSRWISILYVVICYEKYYSTHKSCRCTYLALCIVIIDHLWRATPVHYMGIRTGRLLKQVDLGIPLFRPSRTTKGQNLIYERPLWPWLWTLKSENGARHISTSWDVFVPNMKRNRQISMGPRAHCHRRTDKQTDRHRDKRRL